MNNLKHLTAASPAAVIMGQTQRLSMHAKQPLPQKHLAQTTQTARQPS